MYYLRHIKEKDNYFLFHYVRLSFIVTPLIQVTFPLLLLVLLNAILLRCLWINRNSLSKLGGQSSAKNAGDRSKEWKVTMTVLTIVVTFLIFNFPSVVMYWLTTTGLVPFRNTAIVNLTYIMNFMVVINKALNFLLYCTSSENFRRRLVHLFKEHASKQFHSTASQDETKLTSDGYNLTNRSMRRKSTICRHEEEIELGPLMNKPNLY